MNYKKIIIILLSIVLGLGIFIGTKLNSSKSTNNQIIMNYKVEEKGKIRYKYIVDYEVVDIELFSGLDFEKPLVELYHDDKRVADRFPSFTKQSPIAEVSKSIKINKNAMINEVFEIKYGEIDEIKDKIRFDITIMIEKLDQGRWKPIYQIVFMERGPYWSLDKGPVKIKPVLK